jgi:hypothetical protein
MKHMDDMGGYYLRKDNAFWDRTRALRDLLYRITVQHVEHRVLEIRVAILHQLARELSEAARRSDSGRLDAVRGDEMP